MGILDEQQTLIFTAEIFYESLYIRYEFSINAQDGMLSVDTKSVREVMQNCTYRYSSILRRLMLLLAF
jgi:hypothetical protein